MSTTRPRLVVAGEALSRAGFAFANHDLARRTCAPFSSRPWGASRFPTLLHARATRVAA
jgi:hypothetical protein